MRIINLVQNTSKWLHWRSTGIGASDINTIIGTNPHKTPFQLWAELTGMIQPKDISNNPNVRRGNLFEFKAKRLYEELTNDHFEPICVENELFDVIHSSLDGYSHKNKIVLEIKCPCLQQFQDIKLKRRLSESFNFYYSQVQYQMATIDNECQYGVLFYYCHDTGESLAFKIYPNHSYQKWILSKAIWFWDAVVRKTAPIQDPQKDVLYSSLVNNKVQYDSWRESTIELVKLLQKKNKLESELKAIKIEEDVIKNKLIQSFDGFRTGEFDGVKVSLINRNGSVDYKSLLADLINQGVFVDIEEYRSNPSSYVKVTVDGKSSKKLIKEDLERKINNLINS